jgi:ubiquinone/menaquinone biosynthesis C-methylase UbiE
MRVVSAGKRGHAGTTAYRLLSEPAYRGAFVAHYDELRPKPPAELFELLVSLSPSAPPAVVVDLGAGTGISTVPWSARADRVIGIDANPEMLALARQAANVEYRVADAERTGLPSGCADLVTCAQSFHWMPYGPTIAEIARLLRPGGVFAAFDYDWPPLIDWEVDAAFLRVIEASGVEPSRPEKAAHCERLLASGRFRAVREALLQARELADAEHVSRLPLAFGPVVHKLASGATEQELGLEQLRATIKQRLDPAANTLRWSYRIRLARK